MGESRTANFAGLYSAYARDVYRFALHLSGNTAVAQDITSEVFLRVWMSDETCDFLDSNTFTLLPMAGSSRYHNQIDWRVPLQYSLNHFGVNTAVGAAGFSGFDIVSLPVSGRNGVAWEFNGQAVESMRWLDVLYSQTNFEGTADTMLAQILKAQNLGPFGDGLGLPAATLLNGDNLPPLNQCLNTPVPMHSRTCRATKPDNNRVPPIETTVFVLSATLTEYKLEDDSDYHLVLSDSTGKTMIEVSIIVANGTNSSPPFTATMGAIAPSFLHFGASKSIVATHADGSLLGPSFMSVPGYPFTPAQPGD